MTISFYNRLTEQITDHTEDNPILGQWLLYNASGFRLNTNSAKSKDYLAPAKDGRWDLRDLSSETSISGQFNPELLPLVREQESVRSIGRHLNNHLVGKLATWEEWASQPPIELGILKQAEPSRFDQLIAEHLWHLQEVCRRPRIHLRVEVERLAVSRAHRVPPNAPTYLSAHSEDWGRRKVRSVVPKRILSYVTDDLYDIYENRVAVRLVDGLRSYLQQRIEAVKKIEDVFREMTIDLGGTRHRRERISKLLGASVDPEIYRQAAEQTHKKLESLHYQVLQLLDSTLYNAVPRQSAVPSTLQLTNILTNDQHYRYVGTLWRELQLTHQATTPEEYYQEMQEFCRGFNAFCMLLVCRAFGQLRYEFAGTENIVSIGRILPLKKNTQQIQLLWHDDGSIHVNNSNGKQVLRIIPLPCALTKAKDGDLITSQKNLITDQLSHPSDAFFQLVLYPGASEDRQRLSEELQRETQTLGNDLYKPLEIGLIPISTWEIESVERVTRALRWVLSRNQFASYPPIVEAPVAYSKEIVSNAQNWLKEDSQKSRVFVTRCPTDREMNILKKWLADTQGKLRSQGKRVDQDNKMLQTFEQELGQALQELDYLLQCPVCFRINYIQNMNTEGDHRFTVQCSECGTCWGTNICGNCGKSYPFLIPDGIPNDAAIRTPDWVDNVLGSDVLSIPCCIPNLDRAFICPSCGTCSHVDRAKLGHCNRCANQSPTPPFQHKETLS